ncbi:MAG: glutathione synthase, partial [bacterium]
MNLKLGILMDPIESINVAKDSSFAMLLAAQSRNWPIWYFETADLFSKDGRAWANLKQIEVRDDPERWYQVTDTQTLPLDELDVILMRKDPPFDMQYIYATYLLELAEMRGTSIINKPSALRDANEKLYTAWFPQCCPPTLVSSTADHFRDFLSMHQDIILKPLDGMGGASIFRVTAEDPNISVIIETLTHHGTVKI